MGGPRRVVAREIFLEARGMSADEQAGFLARKCGGDAALREDVEVMLQSIIDLPSVSLNPSTHPGPDSGNSPSTGTQAQDERIRKLAEQSNTNSRYQFREEIGRGAQGAILSVFDNDLRRQLAMKVILQREGSGGAKMKSALLARFLEEAQITGQLDHPGVIPVHELGVDASGNVYFTMPLVRGRELRQIIRAVHEGGSEWTLTRSLSVLLKVCEAMAYAHDKGVVHRDLKPANVMVGKYGEVYVMDWGLARVAGRKDSRDIRLRQAVEASLTQVETDRKEAKEESRDSPLVTMDGAVVGTPAYMPPEQAAGRIDEVDERSDVYAVGAMLYHLIAGHMPYFDPDDPVSPRDVLAKVVQGPPPALHDLVTTPAELEAICEKAMARKRAERYANMGQLADDLRAFLEGRVVHAYRSGALTEFRKWVGRNRGMAASLVAAVLILVLGLIISSLLYVDARENAAHARRQNYVAGVLAADISLERGRILEARSYLDDCAEELRNWEWYHLAQRTDSGLTAADLGDTVTAVAYSADGSRVALGTQDGRVSVRDAETGAEDITLAAHTGPVVAVAWSDDGTRILSVGGLHDHEACAWDAASGRNLLELPLEVDALCAAFDDGLSKLAVGTSANTVHVFALGEELTPLKTFEEHLGSVLAVAFLSGGEHLLSGSEDRTVRLWSLAGDGSTRTHQTGSAVHGLAVHPDGSEYAAGQEDGKITRWSRATGEPQGTLAGHLGLVYGLCYGPEGRRIASASLDRSVRVWDAAASSLLATLWGHGEAARCLDCRPDGAHLASGSADGTLRLWSSHSDGAVDSWTGSPEQDDVGASLFDAETGHALIGWSWDAKLELVDVERGDSKWLRPVSEYGITSLAQSPDGSAIALATEEIMEIRVQDYATGKERPALVDDAAVLAICFTPDGERIVSATEAGYLRIWPAAGGEAGPPLEGHEGRVNAVAASPDGAWIASGSDDGTVRLWDQETGAGGAVLISESEPVYSIAFDPHSRRLAYGYGDGAIAILHDLDPRSRKELPAGHDHRVVSLAFSPNGMRLVSGSHDRTLGVWHVEAERHLLTLRGHTGEVTSVAFDKAGERILSSSMDGTVRVWAGRPGAR